VSCEQEMAGGVCRLCSL